MGILDERFHTLIAPKALGPNKFWSVITCYWRAYLAIAHAMMEDEKIGWIMKNPNEAYKKMCDYAKAMKDIETYYKKIYEYKGSDNIKVITTNYTPICSEITGLSEENIAYVHGAFKWFERAKEMTIFDITDNSIDLERNDYFPFIFLQSGIKPIVHSVQINEWKKAISYLDEDSKLIIVGYRANCDDNHINGLIREYIFKNKQVVYFAYDSEELTETDVLKRFRINDNYNNFKLVKINKDSAVEKFNECLLGL